MQAAAPRGKARGRLRIERADELLPLVAPDGTTTEVTSQIIGFRSVEVRDRALLVNGQRVMIRGVNRHDHHPERGKAVTVDDMRADLARAVDTGSVTVDDLVIEAVRRLTVHA